MLIKQQKHKTDKMRCCFFFLTLIFNLFLFSLVSYAQESIKPKIMRSIRSETTPDAKLEAAIRSTYSIGYDDEKEASYYYNLVDLNNDKKPEVIVFIFGRQLCGTSGCDALLFQKVRGKYKLVTAFEPVRNPIIISQTKTNGWNDLIFYNAGGGIIPGYYSLSQFNGRTYPENPTVEKDSPRLKTKLKGIAYVVGEYPDEQGLKFSPKK